MKKAHLGFIAILSVLLGLGLSFVIAMRELPVTENKPSEEDCVITLTSGDGTVEIVKDGSTEYKLFFSSDYVSADQTVAKELESTLNKSGALLRPVPDVAGTETELEILIGNTNRAVSKELYAAVLEESQDGALLSWGIVYKDGKLAFVASSDLAYTVGRDLLFSFVDEDGNMSVPSDLYVIESISEEDYYQKLREQRLEIYTEINSKFTDSQFGVGTYGPIIGEGGYVNNNPYDAPWIYPTEGEHPRLYFGAHDIDDIKKLLSNPDYKALVDEFWEIADATAEVHLDGIFKTEYKDGIAYNYSGYILGIAEAKALAYLLTGDEAYAVEAVVILKNAMLNLNFTAAIHADTYRGPGHVMCIAAKVYDWCYYALTEADRQQIISGVVTLLAPKLENGMQYPPSGMSGINGHGTGPQLPNSWLSCAIAFYDEVPDWWEFIGGRFFEEYLPAANHQYAGGNVSQGTAIYGSIKLYVMGKAMYMIYALTGENYFTEDAGKSVYFMMSHDMSNGRYFQTGDGSRSSNGARMYYEEALWIAALYNDPVAYAYARAKLGNHTIFSYDNIMQMSPSLQLILTANIDYNGEGKRDGVETIQYFGGVAGQMTAREAWDDADSITVFMKIGTETVANHDIYDHGTFQIYYKGLLACTSGSYAKYGSAAHYYYHQATVAHNGLLVFNPYFADTNPQKVDAYYYSGSQDRHDAMSKMGEILGAAWCYYEDGSSKYAYISGDITDAYNARTVSYIGRTMMTLYTKNEDIPALVITYDKINSVKETFPKTWLLHVLAEPEIDEENLTATVAAGGGKMYVHSLFGASEIVKIGGEGKAYWINGYYKEDGTWVDGKNATDQYANVDNWENIWGRIELRTTGNLEDTMLTVMAITDKDNESEYSIGKLNTDEVQGLTFDNFIIAFTKDKEPRYKEFTFTTEGKGLKEYYISNLEAGTWQILVDGVSVAYVGVAENERLASFVAPTGTVTVKPMSDVIGANGGKIVYSTDGGALPSDAPYTYNNEVDTMLPTTLEGDVVFKGWYTSPNFEPETKVEYVPKGTTGTFRVFALCYKTFMHTTYKDVVIKSDGGDVYSNLDYKGSGTSFYTKEDKAAEPYLEWQKTSGDSIVTKASSTNNLSKINRNVEALTFVVRLSLKEGVDPMTTKFNLLAKQNVNGESISSVQTPIFTTTATGAVRLCGSEEIAQLTTDEVTTLRIVIDGVGGFIKYYNDDERLVSQIKFEPPTQTGAQSVWDYIGCLTQYIFYWYAGKTQNVSALNLYEISIYEGDRFYKDSASVEGGINYQTGGAILPLDAPLTYDYENGTPLPENISFGGYRFGGWYTTESFDPRTRIDKLRAGIEGPITVYAKWLKVITSEDFADTALESTSGNKWAGQFGYKIHSGTGASFKTTTDEYGVPYLEWIKGDGGGNIERSGAVVHESSDDAISFIVKLKITEGYNSMNSSFNLLVKRDVNGNSLSSIQPKLFTTNTAGEVLLGGTEKVATLSTDVITTLRVLLDTKDGKIKFYDENYSVVAAVDFGIPATTGAATMSEFVSCLKDFVFYWYANVGNTTSAFDVYEITVADGNLFVPISEGVIGSNSIVYETDGAILPDGVPTVYDPKAETPLPTDLSFSGYVFGGWYTAEDFAEGTRVFSVPVGTEGPYTVYAKWVKAIILIDYNKESDVDATETNVSVGRLDHKGSGKSGCSFKTEYAEDGTKYLVWTPGVSDPQICNYYTGYPIANAKSNTIGYVLELGKNGDAATSNYNVSIIAKKDVNGNDITQHLNLGQVKDGVFYISKNGSGEVGEAVATLSSESKTVIRLTIDFEDGTINAYSDRGEIIASTEFAPLSQTGAVSALECKKCFVNWNLYIRHTGGASGEGKSIRFYKVAITDGNPFVA